MERSGKCSPRQFATMVSMVERIESRQSTPRESQLSSLERLELEQRRVRDLERQIEQLATDRLMERINGTDDTHIGPP